MATCWRGDKYICLRVDSWFRFYNHSTNKGLGAGRELPQREWWQPFWAGYAELSLECPTSKSAQLGFSLLWKLWLKPKESSSLLDLCFM